MHDGSITIECSASCKVVRTGRLGILPGGSKPAKVMMEFNDATQQGGHGAGNEFEVMSDAYCCDHL